MEICADCVRLFCGIRRFDKHVDVVGVRFEHARTIDGFHDCVGRGALYWKPAVSGEGTFLELQEGVVEGVLYGEFCGDDCRGGLEFEGAVGCCRSTPSPARPWV